MARKVALIPVNAFLLYSIVSIIAVPVAFMPFTNDGSVIEFLIMGFLVTTALWPIYLTVVFFFSKFFVIQNHQQRVRALVMAISLIGALRGFILYQAASVLALEQPLNLLARVLNSSAMTLFWLLGITLVLKNTMEFRAQYLDQVKAYFANKSLVDERRIVQSRQLKGELDEIDYALALALGRVENGLLNNDQLQTTAENIRDIIDSKIRPLTYILWNLDDKSNPKIQLFKVLSFGFNKTQLDVRLGSFFLTLIFLINFISAFDILRALLASLIIFAVTYLYLTLVKKISLKNSKYFFLFYLCLFSACGILLSLLFSLINIGLYGEDFGMANLIFIPVTVVVLFALVIADAVQESRINLLDLVESELLSGKRYENLSHYRDSQDVGFFLHNDLQSELLALSYRVEALKNEDKRSISGKIDAISREFNGSKIEDRFSQFHLIPRERIEKVIRAWTGIVTITARIPNEVYENQKKSFLLVQIIEESVTNAVRHANAKNLNIMVEVSENNSFFVTITNDGLIQKGRDKGLGDKWLDERFHGKWKRSFSESIVTLEINY